MWDNRKEIWNMKSDIIPIITEKLGRIPNCQAHILSAKPETERKKWTYPKDH